MQQTLSRAKRWVRLYKNILKRSKGFIILYTLLLFFVAPFLSLFQRVPKIVESFSFGTYTLAALIGLVSSIGFALYYSRFLHDKKSVDMYFSLPIPRQDLLSTHLLAGATALIVPQILIYSLDLAIVSVRKLAPLSLGAIVPPFCYMIFSILLVFIMFFFIATQTATTFDTLVFGGGFCLLPLVLLSLFRIIVNTFLYGFTEASGLDALMEISSPIIFFYRALGLDSEVDSFLMIGVLCWLVIGFILIIASMWIVKKKKAENVGIPQPNAILSMFMKVIYSIVAGFLLGYLGTRIFNGDGGAVELGFFYFIGSTFFFFVAQVVLSRGFKNLLKGMKQYLAPFSAGVILIVFIGTSGFGLVYRVPTISNVKSVTINMYPYDYIPSDDFSLLIPSESPYTSIPIAFTDEENISKILKAHEEILEIHKNQQNADYDNTYHYGCYYKNFSLEYNLHLGTMSREYYSNTDKENEIITQLYQELMTPEIVEKTDGLFYVNADQIDSTKLKSKNGNQALNLSKTELEELLEALRKDRKENMKNYSGETPEAILTFSYSLPKKQKDSMEISEEFIYNNEKRQLYSETTVSIFSMDKNTIEVLEKLGYSVDTMIDLNTIQNMYIIDFDLTEDGAFYIYDENLENILQTYYDIKEGDAINYDSPIYSYDVYMKNVYRDTFDFATEKLDQDQWEGYLINGQVLSPYQSFRNGDQLVIIALSMEDGYPDPDNVILLKIPADKGE